MLVVSSSEKRIWRKVESSFSSALEDKVGYGEKSVSVSVSFEEKETRVFALALFPVMLLR